MKIQCEVAYASADKQCVLSVELEVEATIEQAIQQSGILTIFPEIDLSQQRVGVFAQLRELSDKVCQGDRIEIYRPLIIDPKEARRSRAKKR